MVTNLQNKYKDRTPELTVALIKDFFLNKGFSLEEKEVKNPMPNTWWCRINLKYNDIEIQGANGKGTSQSFALASGYAELYERYCTLQNILFYSKINQERIFELNYNKNGYYLAPDEIFLSAENAINASPRIINYCNSINDNRNSVLKYFEDNEKGILSLPFKGFNKNSEIVLPLSLLFDVTGSSGSAAGNTLDEALVQGNSELCEHYVENAIYYETRSFKKINLDKINYSNKIKEYFNKLKENNYNYNLFDFSYLYNMPVLGLYIIDLNKKVAFLNLGASPVFEIALERCCTEIFQGHTILGDNLKHIMQAQRNIVPYLMLAEDLSSVTFYNSYPDNFLINFDIVDTFNSDIFLDSKDYDNKELVLYYKNIFNTLGWEVYYRDFSQLSEMTAIKIFVNNIDSKNISIIERNKSLSTLSKKRKWDIVFKWNQIIREYFDTQNINPQLLKQYIELRNLDNMEYHFATEDSSIILDLFTILGLTQNVNINFDILYNSLIKKNSYGFFLNNMFTLNKDYKELFKYSILFNYKDQYNIIEIQKIANAFGIEYTEEDLINKDNILYYLDKIYFSLYYNYYNSPEYTKLLLMFIN